MKKHRGFFGLILFVLIVLLAEFYILEDHKAFSQKEEISPPSHSFRQQKNLNANLQTKNPLKTENRAPTSIISEEAYAISQLDDHPEKTEEKLKNLALSFEEKELKQLKATSLDLQKNGDDRMLAVYLLSLSQNSITASLLEEIVLSPLQNQASGSSEKSFEQVIRLQAVEGLQNREDKDQAIKSLSHLTAKLSDNLLADHSQRALSFHLHGTPRVEQQDLEALENFAK